MKAINFWRTAGCTLTVLLGLLPGLAGPALASPWAEVGDNQLRSDIELLAAAGAIDGITTHWPLPWQSIVSRLRDNALAGQPVSVQMAARRVLSRARGENLAGFSGSVILDGTNAPSVVRGFDAMGRGESQAQLRFDFNSSDVAGRLALGGITQNFRGNTTKIMPEGTYLAAKLGDVLFYGGYLDHWWGPGQISALSLSNNARPMPQIGLERVDTSASSLPILHWLGPWQFEFLLGYLDGPRLQKDTFYNAARFSFNPLPGLEIGLARTEQFCGQGHACAPIRDYFDFNNDPLNTNRTNDQGLIDIKYSIILSGVPMQVYMQLMNEDSSPFVHSGTSHLFGASIFLPTAGNPLRLTAEYTDSVPTSDIFSFGNVMHGFAYNNATYPDGMRYRGRTLGFSLDSDSRLLSLQGGWTDPRGRFYELSLHHAEISNSYIGSVYGPSYNAVSAAPVIVNIAEAKVSLPARWFKMELAVRLQDDRPRPKRGFEAAFEAALRFAL